MTRIPPRSNPGTPPRRAPSSAARPAGRQAPASAVDDVFAFEAGGLPVLFQPNRAHEVVAARLYVRGGATNLDAATAGAELMYARAARRGTRRYPKQRLNAELARLGAELGAGVAEDYSVFNLRCLRRHFGTAWDLLTDVVLQPLLEPAEVEVVRQQMLLEIRQLRDNPDAWLEELARERCYAGHPYAPNPSGAEPAVSKLDPELLRGHMQRHLARSNLLLVVVGDLEREELEPLAASVARDLSQGSGPPPRPPALRFPTASLAVEARALPTNYVLGQFAAPAPGDADHVAALLALSVLRDRFFEEVRTKRNLSYAPSAGLGHSAANLGSIYVTAVDPVTTLGVMRDEMRRLQQDLMEPKDLQDKVRVFVTRYHIQNETSHALAGFLASYELLAGGWRQSREFVPRLEALRPEDVQLAAQGILRHIQYIFLGDPARADPRIFVDP